MQKIIQNSILFIASFLLFAACAEKPASSDPVAQAKARISEISLAELSNDALAKYLIIDVREPDEHATGYIPNALLIPRDKLEFRLPAYLNEHIKQSSTDVKQTPILLYCRSGNRSALAADTLQNMGFTDVVSLQGGITAWEADKREITKPTPIQ